MSLELTGEQRELLDCNSNTIAINAFAGAGKTSTLVQYAKHYESDRMLYLAYNSSMSREAKAKFGENVDCMTVHALAYKCEGHKYNHKLADKLPRGSELIAYFKECHDELLSTQGCLLLTAIFTNWLHSVHVEIEDSIPDFLEDESKNHLANYFSKFDVLSKDKVISNIRNLWYDMCDINNKEVKMIHDGYLKLFQLAKYNIKRYKHLLLDEAQDSNCVTLDIFYRKIQAERKVMVGDIYQAIYQFRGSVNGLIDFQNKAETCIALTNSFRFGQHIADYATLVLNVFRMEKNVIVGKNKQNQAIQFIDSMTEINTYNRPLVLLSRGNAILFETAFEQLEQNKVPYFTGGVERYELDLIKALCEIDTFGQMVSKKYQTKYNKLLQNCEDVDRIRVYAEEAKEFDLLSFCNLIKKYSAKKVEQNLNKILDAEEAGVDHRNCDMVLLTAHRSKGLQYHTVVIANDFVNLNQFIDIISKEQNGNEGKKLKECRKILNFIDYQAETNLFYVAVTRAEVNLYIMNSSTTEYLQNPSWSIPEEYLNHEGKNYQHSEYDDVEKNSSESIQESQTSTFMKNITYLIQAYDSSSTAKKLLSVAVSGVNSFLVAISKMPASEFFQEPKSFEEAIFTVCNNIMNIEQVKVVLYPNCNESIQLTDEVYDDIYNQVKSGRELCTDVKLAFWSILWLTDCLRIYQLIISILPRGARNEEDFVKIFGSEGGLNKYKELVKSYIDKASSFEYCSSNGKMAEGVLYVPTALNLGTYNVELYKKFSSLFASSPQEKPEATDRKYDWYLKAANQGDAEAQFNLGVMYLYGRGVSQDDEIACDWYKKAASQGYASAQNYLGVMYLYGRGVPKNYEKAWKWYLAAANQGDEGAQNDLGTMYYNGSGVTQNYEKAFEWCLKAANQGNATAQNNMGTMYYNGRGVHQDDKIACDWYIKSANQGFAEAQNNLGDMYYNGRGVHQDDKLACDWYKKAANQGLADAQNSLGDMYYNGRGVAQDYKIAYDLYKEAANQGNATAQFNLGFIYEQGRCVPENHEEAFGWYFSAASQGNADAQFNLAMMYSEGRGVPLDNEEAHEWYNKSAHQSDAITQKRLWTIHEKVMGVLKDDVGTHEWCLKAANQGNATAQNNMGTMYYNGIGVPQNYEKAFEWYLKAANQGNVDAQKNLGWMYYNGRGVPKNYEVSFEWCLKSANQGDVNAQKNLGDMYYNGIGVLQNYEKAIEWYLKAANQGNVDAQNDLGWMHSIGTFGVSQDDEIACDWYKKAANQGNADAQLILGSMYEEGRGVPQNYEKAIEWYLKAANQGNTDAQSNLGWMYSIGRCVPQNYKKAHEWCEKVLPF